MAVKGFLFSLDAIFAALLVSGAVLLYLQLDSQATDTTAASFAASDVLRSLERIPLVDIDMDQAWKDLLYADTGLEPDDSVLYAIAMLWVLNDSRVDDLSSFVMTGAPNGTAMRLVIEDEEIFAGGAASLDRSVAVSRQQVAGIDKGKPVAGTSSAAYLRKLSDKGTQHFALLGGFVGQGNITVTLTLPDDVDASRVSDLTLEADIPDSFALDVGGTECEQLTPATLPMEADVWNLSACIPLLTPGDNSVRFRFDDIDEGYIAGGYVRATFTTDTFTTPQDLTETRYVFPRIEGLVNLYDAVSVPQTLNGMEIRLHYFTDDPGAVTYLAIGEKTVWSSNATGEVTVTLTDTNLSLLDYEQLSNTTVPIRFASFNTTEVLYAGGDADVVVITDYSGSMKKSIADWGQGNSGDVTLCDVEIYPEDAIRRTHLARCLDKEIVEVLFNESAGIAGNRLWPVHYVNNVLQRYNNPEDREALLGYYESFSSQFPQQGSGKTCIACALSEAYQVFAENPEENRSRYIILMSDGLPTHCTGAGCGAMSPVYGSQICEGLCDVNGQNCNEFGAMCTDSSCGSAISNVEAVAQSLKDDWNVTIYAVGYGPMETCTNATQLLDRVAQMTGGTYQHSSSPEDLRAIYQNISYTILEAISFESQTASARVDVAPSVLYGDSYVLLSHDLPVSVPLANEIEITRQTDPLGSCDASVSLPGGVRFKEAAVVSYSGPHWTDLVTLNGTVVHNLSQFLVNYTRLGDPYHVALPPQELGALNQVRVNTGDNSTESTGCSLQNSIIYTAYVPSATSRTKVLPGAEGCTWTIEQDLGGTVQRAIPSDYAGANTCSYTNASIQYDPEDALQEAVYDLLSQLDYDGDGTIFVGLDEEDLEILITQVSSVPYLWGPVVVRVEVTR